MNETGRKTKLTKELIQDISNCIKDGLYIRSACKACGISKSTYYDWMDKAERGEGESYIEFAEAIELAEAEDKKARLKSAKEKAGVRNSWEEDWRYLESRYPEEYGKKAQVSHTYNDGERNLTILLEELRKPPSIEQNVPIDGEFKVLDDSSIHKDEGA